jgi:DNA-binding MarR family transcriptional regulator
VPQADRRLPAGPVRDAAGDELQIALRRLLTAVAATRTALARRLEMSVHDIDVMEHVMLADDPLGPVELARRLGVTSAATTQAVDRLEDAGHVRRRPHPSDGRRKAVEVTGTGAAHVYRELAPLLALTAEAAEGMGEHDREVVAAYLTRLVERYQRFAAQPGPAPAPDPQGGDGVT